jgi:hypothetical protein
VMVLERFLRHVRRECVIGKGEGRQCECHNSSPDWGICGRPNESGLIF